MRHNVLSLLKNGTVEAEYEGYSKIFMPLGPKRVDLWTSKSFGHEEFAPGYMNFFNHRAYTKFAKGQYKKM